MKSICPPPPPTLPCPNFWNPKILDWHEFYEMLYNCKTNDKAFLYSSMQIQQQSTNANFILNEFIKDDSLTAEIAFNIMENCIKTTNNALIKNYFLKTTLQYFYSAESNKQHDFFIPKSTFMPFAHFLYLFAWENSAGSYKCYQECIRHYRGILLQGQREISKHLTTITNKHNAGYKKFAICLYGILRGDYKATLEDIITNLAIPLNADVFLFTWDMCQVWSGLCGWTNWVMRMLDPSLHSEIPDEIAYHLMFHENFPNVYRKINTEYLAPLDSKDIENLQKKYPCLKHYEIVNQDKTHYEGKDRGGGYHLCYGIHRAVELMKDYEKLHNIEYDFIFTLRSDGDIQYANNDKTLALQEIQKCNNNEIFDTLSIGASNISIYGPRDVMLALASLYNLLTILPKSIYHDIGYNNHITTFIYLTTCGVEKNLQSRIDQQYAMGNKCQKGMVFPDIQQELQIDLNELIKQKKFNTIKIHSFAKAFSKIGEKYPPKNMNHLIAKPVDLNKNERLKNMAWRWYVQQEEAQYISPQDLAAPIKILKLISRYFPNRNVRRSMRRLIGLFNFAYKKIYGENL